mgnify:FL=1
MTVYGIIQEMVREGRVVARLDVVHKRSERDIKSHILEAMSEVHRELTGKPPSKLRLERAMAQLGHRL